VAVAVATLILDSQADLVSAPLPQSDPLLVLALLASESRALKLLVSDSRVI
jgi:hypothetical protein